MRMNKECYQPLSLSGTGIQDSKTLAPMSSTVMPEGGYGGPRAGVRNLKTMC